ncbi:hypothetical protein J6590_088989 [Homalodisca vitripennis]|nr:hypothetical protein J6590_088989 [Homalodisca vitripennis]
MVGVTPLEISAVSAPSTTLSPATGKRVHQPNIDFRYLRPNNNTVPATGKRVHQPNIDFRYLRPINNTVTSNRQEATGKRVHQPNIDFRYLRPINNTVTSNRQEGSSSKHRFSLSPPHQQHCYQQPASGFISQTQNFAISALSTTLSAATGKRVHQPNTDFRYLRPINNTVTSNRQEGSSAKHRFSLSPPHQQHCHQQPARGFISQTKIFAISAPSTTLSPATGKRVHKPNIDFRYLRPIINTVTSNRQEGSSAKHRFSLSPPHQQHCHQQPARAFISQTKIFAISAPSTTLSPATGKRVHKPNIDFRYLRPIINTVTSNRQEGSSAKHRF